jgi:hypothetical protein
MERRLAHAFAKDPVRRPTVCSETEHGEQQNGTPAKAGLPRHKVQFSIQARLLCVFAFQPDAKRMAQRLLK